MPQPPAPPQTFSPTCPVCGATTVPIYDKNQRRLFACNKCHTDVIVPFSAWVIASERNGEKSDS